MGSANSKRVGHLSRDERRWLDSQDPNQIAALITAARKSHSMNGLSAASSQNPLFNQGPISDGYCSCSSDPLCDCGYTSPSSSELLVTESTNLPPFYDDAMELQHQRYQAPFNNSIGHNVIPSHNNQQHYSKHSRHRRAVVTRNSGAYSVNSQQDQYGQPFVPVFPSEQARHVTSYLDILEASGNIPAPIVSSRPQKHIAHRTRKNNIHAHQAPPLILDQQQQQQYNPQSRRNQVKNKTFSLAANANYNTGRLLTSEHQQQQHNNPNSNSNSNTNYMTQAMTPNMDAETQRGLNFTRQQRGQLGLMGLLPPAYQDKELQIEWVINYLDQNCGQDPLCKYIFLRNLKDFNETLFYAALMSNVELLMPIVYTPVVGLACQRFSSIYLRPRGLFISMQDSGKIGELLSNWSEKDVRVIVFTDGERILGLGDLGANGMGISIGKLSLYTALAGVPPKNVLPITLDVGTNNEINLADPFYIGLRQKRIRGQDYVNLVDEFMRSVVDRWGRSCLIQFEDFGNQNAFHLLERYRASYCTFNDDIQGTASVCLSGLLSATKIIDKRLSGMRFLFYGSGEANLGTANLLLMAMLEQGIDTREAKSRIWLVDSKGLLVRSRTDLTGHKRTYAQEGPQLSDLLEIIEFVKPSAIIGASAQGGAFNETICNLMVELNDRPIIFALSNPTSKAECTAQQAYEWTQGKCIFASGSPFEPVEYNGRRYVTGQGNNAYIFPAVGLAAIAGHMHTIPEEAFLVAASALSDLLTPSESAQGLVYPSLTRIRECTLKIGARLLEFFYSERLATYRPEPTDKVNFLKSIQYNADYPNIPNMASRNNFE